MCGVQGPKPFCPLKGGKMVSPLGGSCLGRFGKCEGFQCLGLLGIVLRMYGLSGGLRGCCGYDGYDSRGSILPSPMSFSHSLILVRTWVVPSV